MAAYLSGIVANGLVLEPGGRDPSWDRRCCHLPDISFKVNALDPFIYFIVAGLLTAVAAIGFCLGASGNSGESDCGAEGRLIVTTTLGLLASGYIRILCQQLGRLFFLKL